ncbi:hypothetical protein BDV98DRAFT_471943, partial [Pterulicium gracile]
QGNGCVSDYAAVFQELCIGTDRLDTNNRDCFLEHLSKDIKDNLVVVEDNKRVPLQSSSTRLFGWMINVMSALQQRRTRKPSCMAIIYIPDFACQLASQCQYYLFCTPAAPAAPSCDPNVMEINAARVQPCAPAAGNGYMPEQSRACLHRRCYRCGSLDHRSADSNYARKTCGNCGRPGNHKPVYMSKL